MLRISTLKNAADYYTKSLTKGDYYSEQSEITGQWEGLGALQLGLSSEITKEQFDRLCAGHHPLTGEQLTSRIVEDRREAYDFTFSVPKSVSLLSAVTVNPGIEKAITDSMIETMKLVETNMQCHVRINNSQANRVTGNIVYGYFLHRNSRPIDSYSDPQLHIHTVVMNTTFDSVENKWKAVEIRDKKENAPYYQAIFDSKLALKLQDIGLPVVKRRGDFEIAGIDDKTIESFSRRTSEINKKAIQDNILNPNVKGQLGARTRKSKSEKHSQHQLREIYLSLISTEQKQIITELEKRIKSPLSNEIEAIQYPSQLIEEIHKRPIIVDADYYKKVHNDYENDNHHIYGKMAKELFFEALELPEIQKVIFTAGGSGSGKSEIILKRLDDENFKGIIVDGTLANYNQAIDNITRSLNAGKQVEIRGIVTDLNRAFDFVLQRENITGRGVPLGTFLDKHIDYVESLPKIIKYFENEPNIKFVLYDNKVLEKVKIERSKDKILDLFKSLSYNRTILESNLKDYEQKYRHQYNLTNSLTKANSDGPNPNGQSTNPTELKPNQRGTAVLPIGQTSNDRVQHGNRVLPSIQDSRTINERSEVPSGDGRGDLPNLIQTKKYLDYTLEKTFERHSSISEQRLIGEILKEGVCEINLEQVNQVIANYKDSGILVSELTNPKINLKTLEARPNISPAITTQVALQEEQRIISTINSQKRMYNPINTHFAKELESNTFLNYNQKIVIKEILSTRDGITMLEGKAGTGKTTTLKKLEEGLIQSNKFNSILVLAPTIKAVEVLKAEGFISATTVQKYLRDQQAIEKLEPYPGYISQSQKGNINQNCQGGVSQANKLQYLVVDEASLVSVRQMDKLLKIANTNDQRVLLVGDTKQHKSVERGNTLQTIKDHSKIEVYSLNQIQRQKELDSKLAVELLGNGQTIKGIDKLAELGFVKVIPKDQERLNYVAQIYVQNLPKVYVNKQLQETIGAKEEVKEGINKEVQTKNPEQTQNWLQKVGQRLFGKENDKGIKSEESKVVVNSNEVVYSNEVVSSSDKIQYEKLTPQNITLVITPTHLDGHDIHNSIRQRLKTENLIDQKDHTIDTLRSLSWTNTEKSQETNYQTRQVLQFSGNIKQFKKGERFEIIEGSIDQTNHNNESLFQTQSKLQIQNIKTSQIYDIPSLHPSYFDVLQKEILTVSKGDLIQLQRQTMVSDKNNMPHKTTNGATYQIKHISSRTGDITLSNDWIIPKDFRNLKSAYYSTSHASQGQTVNHSIFYTSSRSQHLINQDMVYVANSRYRLTNTILTPNLEEFKQYAKKPDPKSIALEVVQEKQNSIGKIVETALKPNLEPVQKLNPVLESSINNSSPTKTKPDLKQKIDANNFPTLEKEQKVELAEIKTPVVKRRMKM